MTTSRESLSIISALLQVHQITDRAALLPVLVHALAAEHGPAAAVAYLSEPGETGLHLALTAAAGISVSREAWEAQGVPATATESAGQALPQLNAGEPPAGPLARVTTGLWPEEAAAQVEAALAVRLAAVAPVRSLFGQSGFVVLLFLGDCPAELASGATAHAAAALGRLLDRELEQEQEGGAIVTGEIESTAGREISRAQRYGRVLSLSLLERTDGGAAGSLLTLAARTMRRPDTAGMLADGRVVALLPETPPEGAASFLRRLHDSTAAEGFTLRGGSASYPDDGATFAALLGRAAERLRALEPAAQVETESEPQQAEAPAPAGTGPGRGLATVGIRIAPIDDSEISGWRALLQRLPSVVSAEACGFDGISGTFNVMAPSVTRLLVDLQGVAAKMDARLSPTITGEVSISLRAAGARPREMRAVPGGVRPMRERATTAPPNGAETAGETPAAETATPAPPRRPPAPPAVAPEVPLLQPAGRPRGHHINLNRPGLALLIAIPVALLAILGVARLTRDDTPAAVLATPKAQISPVPATASIPAPASTAAALPRVVARDLKGGCLPEPGQTGCDALRAALWSGDLEAWQRWLQSLGQPVPDRVEVFERVSAMRLAVNDPAARQDIARVTNAPLPLIAGVAVSDGAAIRLASVELVNFGYAPAGLGGAVLPGGLGTVSAGATLAPGARCAVSTTPTQHTCPFSVTGAQPASVKAGDTLQLLAADGRELDAWVMPQR